MVNNFCCCLTSLPSQCIFCRQQHDHQDHVFLHCPKIRPLWVDMGTTFSGPMPQSHTIKAHLLRWWKTSSSCSMLGQLKVIVPSLVTWELWKSYAACRFGEDHFNYYHIHTKIKGAIYTWCAAMNEKKFASTIPHLVQQHYSPPIKTKRFTIVC